MRRRNRRRCSRYEEREDINPMNFVSNLSDVMLILAVGIMLALILHWNVKIESPKTETGETSNEEAISFGEDDLENMEELPEDLAKMGDVYYDPVSGKYYIVKDHDAGE